MLLVSAISLGRKPTNFLKTVLGEARELAEQNFAILGPKFSTLKTQGLELSKSAFQDAQTYSIAASNKFRQQASAFSTRARDEFIVCAGLTAHALDEARENLKPTVARLQQAVRTGQQYATSFAQASARAAGCATRTAFSRAGRSLALLSLTLASHGLTVGPALANAGGAEVAFAQSEVVQSADYEHSPQDRILRFLGHGPSCSVRIGEVSPKSSFSNIQYLQDGSGETKAVGDFVLNVGNASMPIHLALNIQNGWSEEKIFNYLTQATKEWRTQFLCVLQMKLARQPNEDIAQAESKLDELQSALEKEYSIVLNPEIGTDWVPAEQRLSISLNNIVSGVSDAADLVEGGTVHYLNCFGACATGNLDLEYSPEASSQSNLVDLRLRLLYRQIALSLAQFARGSSANANPEDHKFVVYKPADPNNPHKFYIPVAELTAPQLERILGVVGSLTHEEMAQILYDQGLAEMILSAATQQSSATTMSQNSADTNSQAKTYNPAVSYLSEEFLNKTASRSKSLFGGVLDSAPFSFTLSTGNPIQVQTAGSDSKEPQNSAVSFFRKDSLNTTLY
jgi:hypothetical protein